MLSEFKIYPCVIYKLLINCYETTAVTLKLSYRPSDWPLIILKMIWGVLLCCIINSYRFHNAIIHVSFLLQKRKCWQGNYDSIGCRKWRLHASFGTTRQNCMFIRKSYKNSKNIGLEARQLNTKKDSHQQNRGLLSHCSLFCLFSVDILFKYARFSITSTCNWIPFT